MGKIYCPSPIFEVVVPFLAVKFLPSLPVVDFAPFFGLGAGGGDGGDGGLGAGGLGAGGDGLGGL